MTPGKRVHMTGTESVHAGKNYDHADKFLLNGIEGIEQLF